jgi:hypothetical protein
MPSGAAVRIAPTFAMAALASIGDLPDTIMDRAVVVRMRRRSPAEKVDPYRTRRDAPPLNRLREWIEQWAGENAAELEDAEPKMPVEDRAAVTWEPLVAIADLIGGPWPDRARKSVLALVGAEAEADMVASLGMRLLADIKELFENFTVAFMKSQDLVSRLRKLEDVPWLERDLNTTALAAMLRPYGIRPGHNSARTERGYDKEAFRDAFARYLPSEPVQPRPQDSDQRKLTDGSKATDGSTRPAETTRTGEAAGQPRRGHVRTGADGYAPMTWPEDSHGAWEN